MKKDIPCWSPFKESFVLDRQDVGEKGKRMHFHSMFSFYSDPISLYLNRLAKCFEECVHTASIALLDPCALSDAVMDIHAYMDRVEASSMREMFQQSMCNKQDAERFFVLLLWCLDHGVDASAQSVGRALHAIFQKTPWGVLLAEYANSLLISQCKAPKDIKIMMHKIDARITSCFLQPDSVSISRIGVGPATVEPAVALHI